MLRNAARRGRKILAKLAEAALVVIWPKYMSGGNILDPIIVIQAWFRQKIIRINSHVSWPVHSTTQVKAPSRIQRGSRAPGLGRGCYLDGRNRIVFGTNVWVGPYVSIISMNHDPFDYERYLPEQPIRIDRDCWLGQGAIILPGVHLGPHTIVGAGAVVTKSFPDGDQVIGGNPAKIIKYIAEYQQ